MARATGKTAWCAVLPVMVVVVPAALLAQAPGRPRTNNLAEYELRCKDARVPLVDLWKSCQFGAAQDPDMPLTEAELGRIRRGTGGGSPTSCEVVPVSSANPTSREPALGASAVKDQPAEFSLLLRAAIFSSIPPEAQRGCLTPGAAAFKKLIARRRSDLLVALARDATPAGRLYGLCALRSARDAHYRALLRDAARSVRTVILMDGCTAEAVSLRGALRSPASPQKKSTFETACDALQSAVADAVAGCGT
jgi:hypothetical protein